MLQTNQQTLLDIDNKSEKPIIKKLSYIGSKEQKLQGLKGEASDFIAQIEDCSLSQSEDKEMATYKQKIKDCETKEDIDVLIKQITSDLGFYESREFEREYQNKNYPSDDYGEGYYQKV